MIIQELFKYGKMRLSPICGIIRTFEEKRKMWILDGWLSVCKILFLLRSREFFLRHRLRLKIF